MPPPIIPGIMASPMAPGVDSSSELLAESMPTIVFLKYGPDLESPWSKRDVCKERFKNKIAALPPDLAPSLVLTKVHLKQNGWALHLFFLPVPDHLHPHMLAACERWAGNGGHVRILFEEETSLQVCADARYKSQKRKESESLGDLDKITSIMGKCLDLQGEPVDRVHNKADAKSQRKTARLVAECANRAQAHKERELLKKPRAEQNPASDSDS